MPRVWSSELGLHVGSRVRVAGWLHRLRTLSEIGFLLVRDARGVAQVVVEDRALLAWRGDQPNESAIEIEGTVAAVAQAPSGLELHEPAVRVIARAVEAPPVDLYRPTLKAQPATILDHAAVTLRHPRRRALFALEAASVAGYRQALADLGFVEIPTPKLVGAATDGGANVFHVDYFGRPAFLAQSPQFYKQIMVGVFVCVYETGPVFRAEPHDTPRHLNEYLSLDFEMGFVEDHRDVMAALTTAIRGMLAAIRATAEAAVA